MIINANALRIPLADQSVHCIVTSPPYWGLRDYGTAEWKGGDTNCDHNKIMHSTRGGPNSTITGGQDTTAHKMNYRDVCGKCGAVRIDNQLGLERTPEEYIANMVAVFRECWRVLRDDGTLWLNIGDSYAGGVNYTGRNDSGPITNRAGGSIRGGEKTYIDKIFYGLKPKDLVGIPWRLAFALQADGWYLRSDIVWSKPNPMPESVTDRPTKSHEYLFLLAKQARYYYDAEAIREDSNINSPFWETHPQGQKSVNRTNRLDGSNDSAPNTWLKDLPPNSGRNRRTVWTIDNTLIKFINFADSRNIDIHALIDEFINGQSDKKDIWTIPTAPYKGAHFATFPPALVEPCIKAGTSERGCCPKCGKGWRRVIEKGKFISMRWAPGDDKTQRAQRLASNDIRTEPSATSAMVRGGVNEKITTGWQPSCTCNAGEPIPCLVFDPFVGSGTAIKVAYDLGRRGVGLDLSLDYLDEQARKRIHNGHYDRLF